MRAPSCPHCPSPLRHFSASAAAKAGVVSADLVSELRDARNLRRAVVLREVLGAPVALR